ncbi:MAG: SH3 domain-containing protein [Chloroflexi bacterium]|nr:SH3 domain-containing protein [Chloroflexota bacterium]
MIGPRAVLRALVLLALLLPFEVKAASGPAHHRVGLIRIDNVPLRASPASSGRILTRLVQQTQVEVLGHRSAWTRVVVWASVRGWVWTRDIVFRKPWETQSTYRAPSIHNPIRPQGPRSIHARGVTVAATQLYRAPAGPPSRSLPARTAVAVSAWQQDGAGKVWYRIGSLWAPGEDVAFQTPDPGLERTGGRFVWSRVSGKGMWLTLGTVADSLPDAIVRAAIADGLSHLYLEAAISPLGFHGRDAVGPLIEAAHRRGIAVIAWVYPYLYDLAADVALTREVAAFRTPGGDAFDGIAVDLEQNISVPTVRNYSQLVRAYLGPRYLLVGVTYPPQSFPGYPFTDVARQYNVIAPMDYWHQTKTSTGLDYGHMRYGYLYGYRYAADSIAAIRQVSGHVPIAPIGQTFDNFGRLEMGPHAPSAGEVQGFLAGARRGGAAGVSFFQWMTTTVDEWEAIRGYPFTRA